ncbi:hypothetical protein FQN60_007533 [Etheostoma spectabile]|uniref:Uncharacterized protein n=1 Tax=Etheostoma spectabile TaxID=54343 RepID=A0A5J5CXU6_9PERO|nr:hypothetical protein FQN60_007533 [Etheostoma spectabile]
MELWESCMIFPDILRATGPPERNHQGDKKLCYLCYLKMSCVHTQNELLLLLRLHRPQNSGKYSPVVFPEDLRDAKIRALTHSQQLLNPEKHTDRTQ